MDKRWSSDGAVMEQLGTKSPVYGTDEKSPKGIIFNSKARFFSLK
jgi:hypothetical protein